MKTESRKLGDADRVLVRIETPAPWPVPQAESKPLARLDCMPITTNTRLSWEPLPVEGTLALGAGYDKRKPCRLMLRSAMTEWEFELDVGFSSIAQRYHVTIPPGVGELHATALDEDATFWVLADERRFPGGRPAIWPMSDRVDRLARFFDALDTSCIAEFGWMGGCVLEAMDSLARMGDTNRWNAARDRWLSNFLKDGHLVYEDHFGRPHVDSFCIIEATLPMASIVRAMPDHPCIDGAIAYLRGETEKAHTCEGCYTVAYPLMQMAAIRGREDLRNIALRELQLRRERLIVGNDLYLRWYGDHRTFRNWARGVAWYVLGIVECLHLVPNREGAWAELADHLAERAKWAMKFQREDGLWDNFFDEPGRPADTAGSAGIATALVRAHELGLVGTEAMDAARRCWDELPRHLFVDGWIGGVAPSNKRGEEAQHGIRRVSETFGMGLMGRLAGALRVSQPA